MQRKKKKNLWHLLNVSAITCHLQFPTGHQDKCLFWHWPFRGMSQKGVQSDNSSNPGLQGNTPSSKSVRNHFHTFLSPSSIPSLPRNLLSNQPPLNNGMIHCFRLSDGFIDSKQRWLLKCITLLAIQQVHYVNKMLAG